MEYKYDCDGKKAIGAPLFHLVDNFLPKNLTIMLMKTQNIRMTKITRRITYVCVSEDVANDTSGHFAWQIWPFGLERYQNTTLDDIHLYAACCSTKALPVLHISLYLVVAVMPWWTLDWDFPIFCSLSYRKGNIPETLDWLPKNVVLCLYGSFIFITLCNH